jgi:hypothetical protein
MFATMEKYGITEKLFCITTDNASNNGKMMRRLSVILKEEKGIIWDPKAHHIACLNYVINLAANDFMKSIKLFEGATNDVEGEWDEEEEEGEEDTGIGNGGRKESYDETATDSDDDNNGDNRDDEDNGDDEEEQVILDGPEGMIRTVFKIRTTCMVLSPNSQNETDFGFHFAWNGP